MTHITAHITMARNAPEYGPFQRIKLSAVSID